MEKMSSITFPDGSSYEVVDDTARAQIKVVQGLIGETLFEGNVLAGSTIEFDATKHSLFAVTVHMSLYECVVFCGKTKRSNGAILLHGGSVASKVDDFTPLYFRFSIALSSNNNTHTVKVAECDTSAEFSASAGNCQVTKIVGIV